MYKMIISVNIFKHNHITKRSKEYWSNDCITMRGTVSHNTTMYNL